MNSAPNMGLNSKASEKRQSDGDPTTPQGPGPTSPPNFYPRRHSFLTLRPTQTQTLLIFWAIPLAFSLMSGTQMSSFESHTSFGPYACTCSVNASWFEGNENCYCAMKRITYQELSDKRMRDNFSQDVLINWSSPEFHSHDLTGFSSGDLNLNSCTKLSIFQ